MDVGSATNTEQIVAVTIALLCIIIWTLLLLNWDM